MWVPPERGTASSERNALPERSNKYPRKGVRTPGKGYKVPGKELTHVREQCSREDSVCLHYEEIEGPRKGARHRKRAERPR
jgi:hypothetical protein